MKDLRTAVATLVAAGALLLTAACSGGGLATPGTAPATAPASGSGNAPLRSTASSAPRPSVGGPYVALGDSYTSAPRIPPQHGVPAGCDRSGRNYPSLVAEALGIRGADFRDASCSGATTADLSLPQTTAHGTNPAQLSALSPRTRLVTVGIGGNDVGFIQVITRCVQQGVLHSLGLGDSGTAAEDAPCQASYAASGGDLMGHRIGTAGRRLAAVLADIRQRAPHAQVFVVGYPALVPATGTGSACPVQMGLADGDVAFLHAREQQLNAEIQRRARAAGAHYVDTWTPSQGHDACSAPGTRWIEPLSPVTPAAPIHPNARGERGMADAVLRAIRGAA